MAGTYSQIYLHIVFGTRHRQKLMHKPWRIELYKYMAGIIRNKGQKPININGVEDHVHLLVGIKPVMRIDELVRDIKNNSGSWVNERQFTPTKFRWQGGYGAFSVSQSMVRTVYDYIDRQELHHATEPFEAEYLELLQRHSVDYDDRYVFDPAA